MRLVSIKHSKHEEADNYLFTTDYPLKKGWAVICDTRYGEQVGYVVDDSVDVENEKVLNLILNTRGVTLPLKRVIGIVIPIEDIVDGVSYDDTPKTVKWRCGGSVSV